MMATGYMGKILLVDLDTGKCREEAIDDGIYERYLSGTGLAARLLYERIPPGADPLGPENVLAFLSGLLTGTGSLFSGRWMVAAKSPLTGTWGDANSGGYFSPAIKRCGYDGIFFRGRSEAPVYLYADGRRAELRTALSVWGRDTVEAEEALRKETSPTVQMALIGPAGERLSLISGICTDKGRMAARSGLGAVMGAKRLKAVVLDGKQRIPVFDPGQMKALSRRCYASVPPALPVPGWVNLWVGRLLRWLPVGMLQDGRLVLSMYRKWGTSALNRMSIEWGDSPIKNWRGSHFDFSRRRSRSIDPDRIIARQKVKYHCYSCPLGCGGICILPGGEAETHKPEYESLLALGGLCLNEDAGVLFEVNDKLNRAGMDTISAGAAVAFAMECYEKGLISLEDTDGVDLSWGNPAAVRYLVEKMITREGMGDLLADGTRKAAERLGSGARECAVHAGGQEPAMHDGRLDPGYALHYSVEATPGRHTLGSWIYYEMWRLWKTVQDLPRAPLLYFKQDRFRADERKARMAAASSGFMNVVNGAGMCLFGTFLGVDRIPLFDWINAATGWNRTPEEYLAVGARIQTVKQAFNVKQGIDPASLRLSPRALGEPPLTRGANRGRQVDMERLMKLYWRQSGWDPETGRPGEESLRKAGIL